jgi:hypothetical protein
VYHLRKNIKGDIFMKPRIFVSSTFYDLKYIREDLSNFIKAHDFDPVMFEEGDIGYTPGKHLDESCYEAMKSSDMVILIIGGNYGSSASKQDDHIEFDKYISVTRKEFKTAVEAGVPIFTFIESSVNSEYGVYEVNAKRIEEKEIEIFFKVAKSINVFRFIKEIKGISTISITEFNTSTNIKDFLSKQWADMFKNHLKNLKQQQEIEQLESMMNKMKDIMEQMQIMLQGVGKKVLDEDYDKIVDKQRKLKVRNSCELISSCITIGVNNSDYNKDKVKRLINLLKDTYKKFNLGSSNLKRSPEEQNESGQYFINKLLELSSHNEIIYKVFNSDDLKEVFEKEDMSEELINMICSDFYYSKLFKILSEPK